MTASVPHGAVAVRMRLFDAPHAEVRQSLTPPFPRWMVRRYEMERAEEAGVDVGAGAIPMDVAIAATAERLKHRLDMIAWAVGALSDLGWRCSLEGDHIVAARVAPHAYALEELDAHGIDGPLVSVCDLDDHGRPRLYEPWELR